jgi:Ca2+/H+ antiporter, TMEM165/GDT1 family
VSSFWGLFAATFAAVFVAELGDKTQLAAFGLAAAARHPWAVFFGSAAALILSSALAVSAGKLLAERLDQRWLHYGGGVLFVALGLLMLVRGPQVTPGPGDTPAPLEAPAE